MAKKEIESPPKLSRTRTKPVKEESTPAWAGVLLAQVQQLSQEVSSLKTQVSSVNAHPSIEEEVAFALANPDKSLWPDEPEDLSYPRDPADEAEEQRQTEEIASKYPEMIAAIENFNELPTMETTVTGEEMDALLAGVRRASEMSVHPDELPGNAALNEVQIQMLVTEAPPEPASTIPTQISEEEVASLLVQAETATFGPEADVTPQTFEREPETVTEIEIIDPEIEALLNTGHASQGKPLVPQDLMSADQIAALLDGPKDSVPAEAPRMSDEEISRLLAEANGLDFDSPPLPVLEPERLAVDFTRESEPAPSPIEPVATHPAPTPWALALVPPQFATRALALPLRVEGEELVCLVATPFDQSALNDLARIVGKAIRPEPGTILQVVKGLREAYAAEQEAGAKQAVYAALPAKPNLWISLSRIWRKAS